MKLIIHRVFRTGNSQAVRIPKEFRLDNNRVEIYRNAKGDVVLHPVAADRGATLLQALQAFDPSFADPLIADRQDSLPHISA